MGLDLKSDYKQLKDKVSATQSYNELKKEYDSVTKSAGESFDDLKETTSKKLSELKGKVKKFEKDASGQFEKLLDVAKISSNGKGGTLNFIKKLLLRVIKKIEPILAEILFDEAIKAIGCDQQQGYNPNQPIYIKVSALDLLGLLKIDPNDDIGKFLYEKNPIAIQDNPFSMNRMLYELTQTPNISYSATTGQLYKGQSGQDLFDIEYTELNDVNVQGPWFKVTFAQRVGLPTTIVQFLVDYYKSIRVVEFTNIIANIMNILTGALDIGLNTGTNQLEVNSKFQILLLRILGICFDNRKEIDVSGVAKIPQDDPIDESFFEFSEIDLRNIDIRISNIKNGVVQYEDCGNVLLPVDVDSIVSALDNLRLVPDNDQINAASQITQALTNNPNWNINIPGGNIAAAVDANFIKLMGQAVTFSLLSPKTLLPIYSMLLALGQQDINLNNSIIEFTKKFKKFMINLISRVGAQFIEKLYNQIKKDLLQLVDSTIQDIQNEKKRKANVIILKLIQILLLVGQLISDWRKCKSVVDELLKIVSLTLEFPGVAKGLSKAAKAVTTGIETASNTTENFINGIGGSEGNRDGGTFGGGGNDDDEEESNGSSGGALGALGGVLNQIPLPLLFASEFLDGFSESRAFINTIEEMQKLGIPTGPMPDGSPNLTVLSIFGSIKGTEKENTNRKVTVAIKPTAITPAGLTIPNVASGIST